MTRTQTSNHVIAVANLKGGVGKTTTSPIAREYHRVTEQILSFLEDQP